MLLPLLFACASNSKPDTRSASAEEQYLSVSDRVGAFVTSNNTASGVPIPVTDDSSSGYVLGETGTTSQGVANNGFFSYSLDPNQIYRGEDWDVPAESVAGDSESAIFDASDVLLASLKDFLVVSNGEDEKNDDLAPSFPFEEEFPFGSAYVFFSDVDDGPVGCTPYSPVRTVSEFAQDSYSWFANEAALTTQTPVDQRNDPLWPGLIVPHEDSAFEHSYWRNVAGAFESHPFDDDDSNPYKQELGAVAQLLRYNSAMTLAGFPETIFEESPDVCVRLYESDALLGATGFVQAQLPLAEIEEALPTDVTDFDVIYAHHLDDSSKVFVAYCHDGAPIESFEQASPLSEQQLDVSELLCSADAGDFANMAQASLHFEF